jgi:hypothetical protein
MHSHNASYVNCRIQCLSIQQILRTVTQECTAGSFIDGTTETSYNYSSNSELYLVFRRRCTASSSSSCNVRPVSKGSSSSSLLSSLSACLFLFEGWNLQRTEHEYCMQLSQTLQKATSDLCYIYLKDQNSCRYPAVKNTLFTHPQ